MQAIAWLTADPSASAMTDLVYYVFPIVLVAIATRLHLAAARKGTREAAAALQEAVEAGLTEPPSLHPVIDETICMGSGACARLCPEHAIGIINGKGVLINAAHCIGHGACAPACPVGAIKLVFGTAKRGMEIPEVNTEFETNVPGIFIAGELGGMGLIRKAVEQGRQAIGAIAKRPRGKADLDLLIVGAGPAGISASLFAQEQKLRYLTIEQEDSLGGTTYHYPRRKLVMTAPMTLPIVGEIKVREVSKEDLMEIWKKVLITAKPEIHFSEQMLNIEREGDAFVVTTSKASYRAAHILLAIGRRGTPRKLGSRGENQSKVVYRLIEAEQYVGTHVLVVGGGDSALEAALDVADQPGTTVTLSYRGNAFNRVKPKNRDRVAAAIEAERLTVRLDSTVEEILEKEVVLKTADAILKIPNDAVIVCAGGELPTPFLKKIGIKVEARYGT
jgi:thioredoxin reductase/Pyruvate/2-oxoacid:ferredoxin oxidoreductase delta subunit